MGWASRHIALLAAGQSVSFRPRGSSMSGRIEQGQLVTVVPFREDDPVEVGDVVLCTVRGVQYLHLVKAVGQDGQYLIGNNRNFVNGWTKRIHGKVTSVRD